MSAYFTPDRAVELEKDARRWLGTPFVPRASIRGAGVDCVNLAAQLYIGAGLLERFEMPSYSMDEGQHAECSKLLLWLQSNPNFERLLELKNICVGDLLCFRIGRTEHHAGIALAGNRFIHAQNRGAVIITTLADPIFKRCLKAVFRPVEAEANR
jgi:cell wall-associated NlpC family hydrolase